MGPELAFLSEVMARLATKTPASARGYGDRRVQEHAILPRLSLTFGAGRGLTPAILGKMFFSTRRPAPETGGQRPTARCALGRKSVWFVVDAMTISSPSPRSCGERVGVRGSCLLQRPLTRIAEAIRPLPASGAR